MLEGEVDGVKVVAWSCNNPVSFRGKMKLITVFFSFVLYHFFSGLCRFRK